MTEALEQWEISRVLIDPENARLFARMDENELDLLAASITEVGIIQPITIRADGRIIAGEQRYRAALRAGLDVVPVIIRTDLGEAEIERIRIHENLMRRGLKPSEQARGIQRLYELNGIAQGNNQHAEDVTPGNILSRKTVAEQLHWSERRVSTLHTLSQLIPALAGRWDAGEITRDVAYQLAQLPMEQQASVADLLADAAVTPALRDEIAEYKQEIVRIQKIAPLPATERELLLDEELAKLRLAKERELNALTFDLDDAKRRRAIAEAKLSGVELWAAKDAVHRTLGTLAALTVIDPARYVGRLDGFDALTILLRADLEIAEGVQDWLRRYAYALRERLSVPQERIKEVPRATVTETAAGH